MSTWLITLQTLVPAHVLLLLALLGALSAVGTLLALPIVLIRLPADYFITPPSHAWLGDTHPLLRAMGHLGKNLAGGVILLAGVVMLVLPGQGLLTIVLGLTLLDIPGKRRVLRALIGRPTILTTINTLRARRGQPPLRLAEDG